MNDETVPSFHSQNLLIRAYMRRLQAADPEKGDTVVIERQMFDDLIRIAERAGALEAADQRHQDCDVTIKGKEGKFTFRVKHVLTDGSPFFEVHGKGQSVLDALVAAKAAYDAKVEEILR
jgi:hypothetical protein